MLPRHSCYIYEILRCKEVGGRFKVIIWGGMQVTRRGEAVFMWKEGNRGGGGGVGVSHCVPCITAIYLFCIC